MPKREARRGKEEVFVLDLLQFKRFRWIIKFDEKWTTKGYPQASKNNALGALGPQFKALGKGLTIYGGAAGS